MVTAKVEDQIGGFCMRRDQKVTHMLCGLFNFRSPEFIGPDAAFSAQIISLGPKNHQCRLDS